MVFATEFVQVGGRALEKFARIFKERHGLFVRVPAGFGREGDLVRIHRFDGGAVIEPAELTTKEWFDALNRFDEPFMPEGRNQPHMP